jgi:hypothetical protein
MLKSNRIMSADTGDERNCEGDMTLEISTKWEYNEADLEEIGYEGLVSIQRTLVSTEMDIRVPKKGMILG